MDVTVIVPTRDRAALLSLTLERLVRQSLSADRWELIVIDDGSRDDETATLVPRISQVRATCIRQEPQGASAARNAAIRVARGKVLVFLDDDAFVGETFLSEHLALHQTAQPVLVAGGIIQVREIPNVIDEAPGWRAYHRHPMPGGNSSVLGSAVRAVGGFDPWFSSYGWQDQELAQRLLRHGLRRRFAWRAPIHHFKAPVYDVDLRAQLARELDRGRMGARFYHKHRSLAIGVTTKTWTPLRYAIGLAAALARTDATREGVMRGEIDGSSLSSWRAALLRARVESSAGGAELARLSVQQAVPNAESMLESTAPSVDAPLPSHSLQPSGAPTRR